MSVTLAISGNLDQPTSALLTSTSATDVLTLAAGSSFTQTVISIVIVNQDASPRKVTVWWNDGTTDRALFERLVAANETVPVALDAPILLFAKQTAKKIKAQAAAANVVTVTVVTTRASQNKSEGLA